MRRAAKTNREIVDKRIRALFPHTVGLDMESYSIYYADSTKSDQYQKFAAFTSSGYVKYLLENYLF